MQGISSWANGIIVSVVIATILEMLLPFGNNKKYIKTILGLYVLFAIIGPIIDKFGGNKYSFNEAIEGFKNNPEYQTFSTNSIENTSNIEKVYKTKLEEDIKSKLKLKGYDVEITALSINFLKEEFGTINQINIKVNKKINENKVNDIEKVDISISKEEKNEIITENEKEDIKKYISEEYQISKEKVIFF